MGYQMGVSEIRGPYFGVLIIRILLFRVLDWGPLFSETPSLKKSEFERKRLNVLDHIHERRALRTLLQVPSALVWKSRFLVSRAYYRGLHNS